MNILFVTARFPYPPLNGDQVRAYHHLRLLARDHKIVLLAPVPDPPSAASVDAVRPFCDHIELVPATTWRSAGRLLAFPFRQWPLQTLLFFHPSMISRARRLCAQHRTDLLHAQLVRSAPVVKAAPPSVATVLDLIDALSVNMQRRAHRSRGPLAFVSAWEARRLLAFERYLTTQYDQLAISSAADRDAIGAYDNLHVVPNGVDLDEHPFVSEPRDPRTIVFSGTMWYFPNVDAARWLVTEVLPLVRAHVPDARLQIVGARPAKAVSELATIPGVEVTGRVPSVHAYVSRATVAVAPMLGGSGGQFKVIEAMAAGTPVVATTKALGGWKARHDEHLLVANDPKSFAAEVVRLMHDAALRTRLTRNGYRLVADNYAWEHTVRLLQDTYERARAAIRRR